MLLKVSPVSVLEFLLIFTAKMFRVGFFVLLTLEFAAAWRRPLPANPPAVRPLQTYSTLSRSMIDVRATRDVDWARKLNERNASLLQYSYAVFLDAGSSGTRMYIYHWNEMMNNTGVVNPQNDVKDCNTKLSGFRDEPEKVGPSLKACFDFAAQSIPTEKHRTTRIRLGATAGMRIVETENATAAYGILTAVQKYLRDNYNFSVMDGDIKILPANDETAYVWAAVNYAAKTLQDPLERNNTWTSLYMGGASTDVSMDVTDRNNVTSGLPADYFLTLFDYTYPLFVKNFICYGKDQAFLRYQALLVKSNNFQSVVYNPCGAYNYTITVKHRDIFNAACSKMNVSEEFIKESYEIVGTANWEECRRVTKQLFLLDFELKPASCPFNDAGTCSLVNRTDSLFHGRLLASGGFAYDAGTLSLLSNRTFTVSVPFDIEGQRHALNVLCTKTYEGVLDAAYNTNGRVTTHHALRACFDGVYSGMLLSDIYRLNDDLLRSTIFSRSVNDEDVSWTLGWALVTSVVTPDNTGTTTTTRPNSGGQRMVNFNLMSCFVLSMTLLVSFVIRSHR